jgi:hypothetical protein
MLCAVAVARAGICCNKDRGETPCSPMCCPSGTNCVNGACTSPAPAQQPVQPMQPPVVVVPTPAPAPVVAPPPQPPVIVPAPPPVILPPPVIVPPPPPVDPTPPVQPNNCGPVNCLPWQFCGNRASGEQLGFRVSVVAMLLVGWRFGAS